MGRKKKKKGIGIKELKQIIAFLVLLLGALYELFKNLYLNRILIIGPKETDKSEFLFNKTIKYLEEKGFKIEDINHNKKEEYYIKGHKYIKKSLRTCEIQHWEYNDISETDKFKNFNILFVFDGNKLIEDDGYALKMRQFLFSIIDKDKLKDKLKILCFYKGNYKDINEKVNNSFKDVKVHDQIREIVKKDGVLHFFDLENEDDIKKKIDELIINEYLEWKI